MKYIATTITALALLLPASASAVEKPAGTFCSVQPGKPGDCYTIEAADAYLVTITEKGEYASWANFVPYTNTYQRSTAGCTYGYLTKQAWVDSGSPKTPNTCVPVATQMAGHQFSKFLFTDIPEEDKASLPPTMKLTLVDLMGEYHFIDRTVYVSNYSTAGGDHMLSMYCQHYQVRGGVAMDRTPQSVYDACKAKGIFKRRESDPDPAVTTLAPVVTADPEGPVVVPTSAAKCAAVGKVAVRSVKVKCGFARTVIAKYAKTLKSPAGWTCTATITDAGRRARCTVKAKPGKTAARTAVYGIWRPS